MKLNEVRPAAGAIQKAWRRGQGPGSGNGKTAGRGNKGQHSRSGSKHRAGFEGGQMPLHRRLPKRGFTNIFRREYAVVNLGTLDRLFAAGTEVTLEKARQEGLLASGTAGLKLLGGGEIHKALVVHAHRASAQARAKIEAAGGRVQLIASEAAGSQA
jgi:large subunit ribosomal protein L15